LFVHPSNDQWIDPSVHSSNKYSLVSYDLPAMVMDVMEVDWIAKRQMGLSSIPQRSHREFQSMNWSFKPVTTIAWR
jgi:hypothetical protein